MVIDVYVWAGFIGFVLLLLALDLGVFHRNFALAGITQYFHYLKYGLSAILVFVGVKMVIVDFYKIPIVYSLLTILGILFLSVLASVVFKKAPKKILP